MNEPLLIPIFNPNATPAEHRARIEQSVTVLFSLLQQHGPAGIKKLSALSNCQERSVREHMERLFKAGRINKTRAKGAGVGMGSEAIMYSVGEGQSESAGLAPKQFTVKKWKPQPIKHDPLHAAFHGIKQ